MSTKTKENLTVVSQEEIGKDIFSLWLQTDQMAQYARPGQFLSLYTGNAGKLLPRQISICEIDKETSRIRLVYRVTGKNTGTEAFSKMQPEDKIEALGTLGNGFPLEEAEGKKVFLIGGGIGIPPMLELAKALSKVNGGEMVQSVIGYRDSHMFLKEEFEAYGSVTVATEDGSVGTKGNVLDAIRENDLKADVIYACGPTPMLRALKAYSQEKGILCYLSLEEKMACGIGACLACTCQTKDVDEHSQVHNKRICKDGPVFLAEDIEL